MLVLESDVYGITMANNTEFRKRLIHSLAQVHSRAESDFKHLRRSLETNIKALVMQSEALKSKAEALESKTETLEMQNLSLELQIEKHVQEHRDLAQSHQQALIDLKARPNVEEENNQLFEQRLATLEKQLSATTRTESSDNAGGTTKLRTKRRCFELDRNPHNIDNPKTKRKYNNIGNDSLHGTFGMVLRSQTKNAK
jgi:chromosome segregation ATPase